MTFHKYVNFHSCMNVAAVSARAQQMLRGNLAWTRYGAGDTAYNWSYTVTWDSAGRDEAAPRRGKNNRVVCVCLCVWVWCEPQKKKESKLKGRVFGLKKKREKETYKCEEGVSKVFKEGGIFCTSLSASKASALTQPRSLAGSTNMCACVLVYEQRWKCLHFINLPLLV